MRDPVDGVDPLLRLLDVARRSARVAVCAQVEAYDAQAGTADITPLVKDWRTLQDGTREYIEPPRVDGCPVMWPTGSVRGITQGLEKGDHVLVLVRHLSHDEVDSGGATPSEPQGARRNDLADAVVLAGYRVPTDGYGDNEYRSDGQPVWYLGDDEAVHYGKATAAYLIARADLILSELQDLANHTHPLPLLVAPSGGGNVTVGGPTPTPGDTLAADYTAPGTAEDIASTRIKVDE